MANLTSVGVTAGVPTSGTGTVSTLDSVMALIGEVQASPTANTELDRLKVLGTKLDTIATDIVAATLPVGAGTAAAAGRITNASDDPNRPRFFSSTATTLTRPANTTAYTANDEISATSPASLPVTVSDTNDAPITVERIRVSSSDTGFAGKNLRAWVYNGATTAGTDNGAFSTAKANYVATFSGQLRTASDGSIGVLVADEGSRVITVPESGAKTLELRLQTLDAATPSANSTTFILTAEGFQGRA